MRYNFGMDRKQMIDGIASLHAQIAALQSELSADPRVSDMIQLSMAELRSFVRSRMAEFVVQSAQICELSEAAKLPAKPADFRLLAERYSEILIGEIDRVRDVATFALDCESKQLPQH